jgi:two-component system chemotaxis response regulator CheB
VSAAAGVRVLIVDDSPVAREVLKMVLEADAGIRVVGMAATGREAVELTARLRPDLVTMDLVMPGMDGMEATQRIMARHPTPILVLSSFVGRDGFSRRDALAAGALDVLEKPAPMPDPAWQNDGGALARKVKSLAQVPVVTHMYGPRDERRQEFVAAKSATAAAVVAIGASTGGPKVVDELLSALPPTYAPAVLVIQHMDAAFMTAMIGSLRQRCALEIRVAEDGDRLQSGRVLFAPAAAHLSVLAGGRVRIEHGPPVGGFRPSVDVTFASLARVYGPRVAGVLLTGMGADGAAGLLAIRQAGGRTMVQDEASCVVFGMPKAAIDLGAVQHVLPPARILRHLLALHRLRRSGD